MKLSKLFLKKGPVFSLEVFPPKRTSPIETIYQTLDELQGIKPDFISVTYGAGGKDINTTTCSIAATIKTKYQIEPLAHLTCINHTVDEVEVMLKNLHENDIENVLALRGDINPDMEPRNEFHYASELIALIRQKGDFHISGACYPEGHIDSPNIKEDILNLKKKVDVGASHLISQLFFDNKIFMDFIEKVQLAGIEVPIQAGIMPVVNKKQIERMVSLCGASLPSKFTKMMQRFENSPEALRDAGIEYATEQIVDLLSQGVDGIHLYTMNNPYIAKKISENIYSLIV